MKTIDLSLTSDLNWKINSNDKHLELELGLYNGSLSLLDPLRVNSLIEAFKNLPAVESYTLFRMTESLSKLIRAVDLEIFARWQNEHPEGDLELFARDLLVDLLRQLAVFLPEEARLFAVNVSSNQSFTHNLRLCHQAAWAPVELIGNPKKSGLGLCLPPLADERLSSYEILVKAMDFLQRPFKLLAEEEIHSHWGDLQEIAITPINSPSLFRILKGFEVTDGKIIKIFF